MLPCTGAVRADVNARSLNASGAIAMGALLLGAVSVSVLGYECCRWGKECCKCCC